MKKYIFVDHFAIRSNFLNCLCLKSNYMLCLPCGISPSMGYWDNARDLIYKGQWLMSTDSVGYFDSEARIILGICIVYSKNNNITNNSCTGVYIAAWWLTCLIGIARSHDMQIEIWWHGSMTSTLCRSGCRQDNGLSRYWRHQDNPCTSCRSRCKW